MVVPSAVTLAGLQGDQREDPIFRCGLIGYRLFQIVVTRCDQHVQLIRRVHRCPLQSRRCRGLQERGLRVVVNHEPPRRIVSVVRGERTQRSGPGGWIGGELARPPRSALRVPQRQGRKLHQEHVPRWTLMSAQCGESACCPRRESCEQAWKGHPFAPGKCEDRIGQEIHLTDPIRRHAP